MLICDREGYVDVALLCDSLLPLKFKLKYVPIYHAEKLLLQNHDK